MNVTRFEVCFKFCMGFLICDLMFFTSFEKFSAAFFSKISSVPFSLSFASRTLNTFISNLLAAFPMSLNPSAFPQLFLSVFPSGDILLIYS